MLSYSVDWARVAAGPSVTWPQHAHFFRNPDEEVVEDYVQSLSHPSLLALIESLRDGNDLEAAMPELFIDVAPHEPRPGWLGHLINDADACQSGDHDEVLRYLRRGCADVNCFNVPLGPPPLMAFVTSQRVKQGEELLTSYFPGFWVEPSALRVPDDDAEDVPDEIFELSERLETMYDDCRRTAEESLQREAALLTEWLPYASASAMASVAPASGAGGATVSGAPEPDEPVLVFTDFTESLYRT